MNRSMWESRVALVALASLMALAAPGTQAQSVFRIVGPDGRVTFSDKPPPAADKATKRDSSGRASPATGGELPFELRQIVSRYPVTLYSGENCAPCTNGRSLLAGRGIPFTERTITTDQDIEALQKLSGESSLPFLTIGGQRIKGFQSSEWIQFLDAAGYAANSQLPAAYRNPAPTPLAPRPKPIPVEPGKEADAASAPEAARPAPPARTPDNPAGIRF